MNRPAALVLAGGQARRLGGGDKPLLEVGGRPMLERIAARLAPQCGALLLAANGDPSRWRTWPGTVVADAPEDRGQGPLAGLLAGLDHLARWEPDAPALLSVPGDVPFLPVDLVARLAAARPPGGVAHARSGGRNHWLLALWPTALREHLRTALRRDGEQRVGAFIARFDATAVTWPTDPLDPFLNVNTPDDLRAAERIVASGEGVTPACAAKR